MSPGLFALPVHHFQSAASLVFDSYIQCIPLALELVGRFLRWKRDSDPADQASERAGVHDSNFGNDLKCILLIKK